MWRRGAGQIALDRCRCQGAAQMRTHPLRQISFAAAHRQAVRPAICLQLGFEPVPRGKFTSAERGVEGGTRVRLGQWFHGVACIHACALCISNKARSRSNSACNSASVGISAWYLLANSWALSASCEYLATAALRSEHKIKPSVGLSLSWRCCFFVDGERGFVFHNHAAYVPIGLHHGGVDGLSHLGAGGQ